MPERKRGYCRIICSVSVVDQLVERILFSSLVDTIHEAFPTPDLCSGVGFDDEHARILGEEWGRMWCDGNGVSSDVSGWEKGYSYELAQLSAAAMVRCATCAPCGLVNALDAWSFTLTHTPYMLPDGTLYERDEAKIMTSGDYLTTTGNGFGRAIVARLVGSRPKVNGDDANEWTNLGLEELKAAYADLSVDVRDVVPMQPDSFEFCSHHFFRDGGGWKAVLSTWQRMLYAAASKGVYDEHSEGSWLSEVKHADAYAAHTGDVTYVGLYDRVTAFLAELGAGASPQHDSQGEVRRPEGLKGGEEVLPQGRGGESRPGPQAAAEAAPSEGDWRHEALSLCSVRPVQPPSVGGEGTGRVCDSNEGLQH